MQHRQADYMLFLSEIVWMCCKFTLTLECFPLTHLYSPRQHPASFPELLCLSVLLGLCHGWCCVLSPLSLLFQ